MATVSQDTIEDIESRFAEYESEIQSYLDRIAELEYENKALKEALSRAVATEHEDP